MNPIDLRLGSEFVVRGAIFPTMNPSFLRETLLEIDRPSGDTIAVGWVPHKDPAGHFEVLVLDRDNGDVTEEYETRNLQALLSQIKKLTIDRPPAEPAVVQVFNGFVNLMAIDAVSSAKVSYPAKAVDRIGPKRNPGKQEMYTIQWPPQHSSSAANAQSLMHAAV
jgi:hypothetical protein